jgi:hypothetical protein
VAAEVKNRACSARQSFAGAVTFPPRARAESRSSSTISCERAVQSAGDRQQQRPTDIQSYARFRNIVYSQ